MGLLEKRLQAILELDATARELVLPPRHGAPETLRHIGHEAEGELLCHEPLDQTLRIGEVSLAAVASLIRQRLPEIQRTGRRLGIPAGPLSRSSVCVRRSVWALRYITSP